VILAFSNIYGTANAIIVELRFKQHAGKLSGLRSAANIEWNVLDNTVAATPMIIITQV